MKNYTFQLSESNSVNINIIRIITIQIIAVSHGLENIGAIDFANSIGVFCLNFLMLISGFLIAHSIYISMNDKKLDFKKFLIRRFSRIYPVVLTVYTLIVFVDWINHYKFLHHIVEFFINILLLNDSVLGYKFYGYNRHLWIFPLFWWQYLFFGWLIVGSRTTKKKYIYYILLGFFALFIFLIIFGMCSERKINFLIIWFLGASFASLMDKLNKFIKKNIKNMDNKNGKTQSSIKLLRKVRYFSLILGLGCFALALIREQFNKNHTAYELIYNLFLAGGILFLFIFAQYSNFKYPKKVKKIINYLASYTLTMFLFHMCLYNLFLGYGDDFILFVYIHIITNILSFIIAYFTERKTPQLNRYLIKKFNLEPKSEKVQKPLKGMP